MNVEPDTGDPSRRPLRTRELGLSRRAADGLARTGISANAISVLGVCSAAAAAGCFAATAHAGGGWERLLWLGGAVLVQGRLAANMFDGMVALRRGPGSRLGDLFNEIPDRASDALILIGLGFAVNSSPLAGALAAAAAILTAYVRSFGASLGAGQDFSGPLAKPQRMFLVTLAAAAMAVLPSAAGEVRAVLPDGTLWVVAGGALITAARRTGRLARRLQSGAIPTK